MTDEQLRQLVVNLRQVATSAPTLTAKLKTDSAKSRPRRVLSPEQQKRLSLLDEI